MLFYVKAVAARMTRQQEQWSTSPLDLLGAARDLELQALRGFAQALSSKRGLLSHPSVEPGTLVAILRHIHSAERSREEALFSFLEKMTEAEGEITRVLEREKEVRASAELTIASAGQERHVVPRRKKIQNKPLPRKSGRQAALERLFSRLHTADLEIGQFSLPAGDAKVIEVIKEQVRAFDGGP